jgi:hypothetical protein
MQPAGNLCQAERKFSAACRLHSNKSKAAELLARANIYLANIYLANIYLANIYLKSDIRAL